MLGRYCLHIAVLAAFGTVAGCAVPTLKRIEVEPTALSETRAQQERTFKARVEDRIYLNRVAWWLATGAAPLCGDRVGPTFGFVALNSHYLPERYRPAGTALLGLGERAKTVDVVPGSQAAKAGLRRGDIIRSLNGRGIPTGPEAIPQLLDLVHGVPGGGPTDMKVTRGRGRELDLSLRPVSACAYPVATLVTNSVNAYADGENIFVTEGMMKFVENDHELAFIVAHELAHNVLAHNRAKQANAIIGGFVGLLFDVAAAAAGVDSGGAFSTIGLQLGALTHSQAFEAEADYFAAYAMALAEFDVSRTPAFWRRMAVHHPKKTTWLSSHPASTDRALALEKIAREIDRKRAAGEALRPDPAP